MSPYLTRVGRLISAYGRLLRSGRAEEAERLRLRIRSLIERWFLRVRIAG